MRLPATPMVNRKDANDLYARLSLIFYNGPMAYADRHGLDEAFEQIEETILPSISLMLDTLLEASTLAQPGVDAEVYAAELRTIALQLETLTREVERMAPLPGQDRDYRAAARA
jgi:hypothetical protein